MIHPPKTDLDKLFVGDLSGAAKHELEEHADSCRECQEYLKELEQGNKHFLTAGPPKVFLAQVKQKSAEERQPHWGNWFAICSVGAAAAVLVVFFVFSRPEEDIARTPEPFLMMGNSSVQAFLKRNDKVSAYTRGSPLKVGDELRFQVTLERENGHVALFAVTTAQKLEVFALSPDGDMAFNLTRQAFLPGSVVVDADPEPVRLFIIVRDTPFRVADVESEIVGASRGRNIAEWEGKNIPGMTWTDIVVPEE